jgi:hypothetical protein
MAKKQIKNQTKEPTYHLFDLSDGEYHLNYTKQQIDKYLEEWEVNSIVVVDQQGVVYKVEINKEVKLVKVTESE